jgi:2-oxoglutarate ferredoxin oxidoreductase subunit alpha
MAKRQALQGNVIVSRAAIAAGCDFYAGYPISPSSEITHFMSQEMPRLGRVFIQMEDEIASIGACIGASLAGKKAMTATSGPGFSLMQENLGLAAMAEVPLVIVDAMRGGPSTGLPTRPSQADLMQIRWGTHGDHPMIALYPAFPEELFCETLRAFNLAERFWTPVVLVLDESLAKAHEDIEIPEWDGEEGVESREQRIPDHLNIYDRSIGENPPRVDFFQGYPIHIDGLEHDSHGWPTSDPEITQKMQTLRMHKIFEALDEIIHFNEYRLEDAEILVFSFGISARAAREAVDMARDQGIRAGLFQSVTVWPFPKKALEERFRKIKKVLTVELNMGQMKYEVERAAPDDVDTRTLLRANGVPFSPDDILDKLRGF